MAIQYRVAPENLLNKRIAAWCLIILCLGLAFYTGSHLKQALDGERDLRTQIVDFSAAGQRTVNAPVSSAVAHAVASLSGDLSAIRKTAHAEELALTAEALILLAGVVLLRTRPATLQADRRDAQG